MWMEILCGCSKFLVGFNQNLLTFDEKWNVCAFVLILIEVMRNVNIMSNDSKRWFSLVVCAIYRRIVDVTIYSYEFRVQRFCYGYDNRWRRKSWFFCSKNVLKHNLQSVWRICLYFILIWIDWFGSVCLSCLMSNKWI